MQLRMSARVFAATAAVALVPVLSSCGLDYATDRDYTPAAGTNDRDADVDVLGAVVVSAEEGSGNLVASFVSNVLDEVTTVESITAATMDGTDLAVDFEPVEVPAGGLVNLADEGGIPVEGELEAGDFVVMTFTVAGNEPIEMEIPVMPACNEWEGLADGPGADDQCTVEAPEVEH